MSGQQYCPSIVGIVDWSLINSIGFSLACWLVYYAARSVSDERRARLIRAGPEAVPEKKQHNDGFPTLAQLPYTAEADLAEASLASLVAEGNCTPTDRTRHDDTIDENR